MSKGSGRILRTTEAEWLFSRDGRRVENGWQLENHFQAWHALRRIAVRMSMDANARPDLIADHFDEYMDDLIESCYQDFRSNPNKYLPQEKRVDLCGPAPDSTSSELTWSKVFSWAITKVTGSR